MAELKNRKHLTHSEFYVLVESIKTHRDGVAKCGCYRDVVGFLATKLLAEGHNLPISEHSIAEALKVTGVKLEGKRSSTHKRTPDEFRDILDILARAVGRLYEKLGEPITPGLARVLAIARREATNESFIVNGKKE